MTNSIKTRNGKIEKNLLISKNIVTWTERLGEISGTITNAYREDKFNYCFHISTEDGEKVISIPWTSDIADKTMISGIQFKSYIEKNAK
jgi:hypothetical protein